MDKKDLDKLMKIADTEECLLSIDQLKQKDFLIDFRGKNQHEKFINEIKETAKNNHVISYINEIISINAVFIECKKLQDEINKIPSKRILSLMLYWGSVFIDEGKSQKAYEEYKKYNADKTMSYEKGAELVITAIKSLIYNEKVYDGKKFKYLPRGRYLTTRYKYQKIVTDYIQNSINVSLWFEKYNLWKKNYISIEFKKDNTVEIKITNKEKLCEAQYPVLKEKINRGQYESQAISEYCFSKDFIKKPIQMDILEFISHKVMDKHFYCDSKDLLVNEVKIVDWIKAYFVLMQLSKNDIDKIVPFSFLFRFILDKTRCKSKKAWIKIFIKNGIDQRSAEIIFDHLIFKKTSTDLYDFPFIPVENKYTISRTVSKWIHPAQSLISRFNSRDINVDVKGKNFEDNLINFLKMVNVPYVKLHYKVDTQEYECDAVLYLDNTFIFCECKSRTGHELESCNSPKYLEDANQLKRISEFYKNNMSLVFKAFEDKQIKIASKKFYSIKNIVIHSRAVDGVLKLDDVYVMDFDSFIMPFDRGSIWEDYVMDRKLKKIFEGDATIYKMFKFYDTPFYVYNYRDCIEFHKHDLKIGKFNFNIEDSIVKEIFNQDFFRKENNIHMKHLLEYNNIPKDVINKILNNTN